MHFSKSGLRHSRMSCAFRSRHSTAPDDVGSARFYPDGGMAVFRSDRLFGLFLGEPGRPQLSGHDHVEPTAFTLFAHGQEMLIDAGYGPGGVEDENRRWYVSAQAHNMPMVNGRGPDQNPAFGDALGGALSQAWEMNGLATAMVTTSYRESHVQRRVWFVNNRYFIVEDDLSSPREQKFSVPWHGLGALSRINH